MKENLIGLRFGNLEVIEEAGKDRSGRNTLWRVLCLCGSKAIVCGSNLKRQKCCSTACPILRKIKIKNNTTHGMYGTTIHRIWKHMIERTTKSNDKNYADYGGRGIKVCTEWMDFAVFFRDMGPSYKEGFSIDRIDNDGNYEPKNCRWASRIQQNNNKRNNRKITTPDGVMTMAEASRHYKIHPDALAWRLKSGWSVARALTTVSRKGIWLPATPPPLPSKEGQE